MDKVTGPGGLGLTGGGSSQTSEQTTPIVNTPPAYAALQNPIASALQSLFGGGPAYGGVNSAGLPLSSAPTTTSSGTFASPMTANESSLLGMLMGGTTGAPGTPSAMNNNTQSYLTNLMNPSYVNSFLQSPTVQGAVSSAVNPLLQAFQSQTMPQLQGQFAANGQVLNGPAQPGNPAASGSGSSAFNLAAANANTGLENAIGSTTSSVMNNALNTAVGQQSMGANTANNLSSTEVNNLVSTLQAEALPRLIDQYGLDQGLQEFNNRINTMLQSLGLGASVSGPDLMQASTGTGTSSSAQGLLSAIGGGGSNGIGGLAAISDRRAKVVGKPYSGALNDLDRLTVYHARYKWDDARYKWEDAGTDRPMIMADEVEKIMPTAVLGSRNTLAGL